ncbi:hypothetical protein CPC08DRAFT_758366 [Agrocybe pediades]|nr:hypothetical protein CPC08DRAFT_758366 [Agrocybe pediades]
MAESNSAAGSQPRSATHTPTQSLGHHNDDSTRSNSELALSISQRDGSPGLNGVTDVDTSHSHCDSDLDSTLNSRRHSGSTPELGLRGVEVEQQETSPSIIIEGDSNGNGAGSVNIVGNSQGDGEPYIKVPAYADVSGRTPPPSYSSLGPPYVFTTPGSGHGVASSSRTRTPPVVIPSSDLLTSPTQPLTSSSYNTIPPASANPFSNSAPTVNAYDYAYSPSPAAFGVGPTPMNASHPLLAAPHAEAYIEPPGTADRRVRWRFAGAMFWAMVVWIGLSSMLGLVVWGEGGEWPLR